jgi:hypothetical protein
LRVVAPHAKPREPLGVGTAGFGGAIFADPADVAATQLRTVSAARAAHQLDANLVFEIADLAAEGRLRRVQPFLSRERQAALLGDRDEIAKVP